jgi:biopolymer transport protein TolQ
MTAAEPLPLWSLIAEATIVVQLVMASLLVISMVSWAMIFERFFALRRIEREIDDFEERFWSGTDLRKLYSTVEAQAGRMTGIESVFVAGFKEFSRNRQTAGDAEAIMQAIQRALRVAMAREEGNLSRNLPFLATAGSTRPYVGLFGTVWGVMNSFRGLATVGQATLQTVAPGISEALIATAMGLFAAIPAVIGYNRYSARVDTLMVRYEVFADELTTILHRAVHGSAAKQ